MNLEDFKDLATFGVKELSKYSVDYGEVFIERKFCFRAKCEENKVESVSSGFDAGIGIRIIKDNRSHYGYTNEFSRESVKSLVKLLVETAGVPSRSPVVLNQNIVNPEDLYCGNSIDIDVKEKIEILTRANDTARSLSDKIKQVSVVLYDEVKEVTIANTLGTIAEEIRPRVVFRVEVVASDGLILQTGHESIGHLGDYGIFKKTTPEEVARKAGRRALKMLKAKPAPAGMFTVVISSKAGGTMIHEAVGHGLEADLANQGLSVYSGKIGKKVASEFITVIDEGNLKCGFGSGKFDDEGNQTGKLVLIENGVLTSFMYDYLEAKKTGNAPTGNGRRESYKHPPIPRMTNTYIAPGTDDPKDIIADTKYGILVVKMGGGQVNTVNGDFVFEVSEGYMIEKGRIGEPIRGMCIIGNGPSILKQIDAVGNDLGFSIGTCGKDGQGVPVSDGMPTIRIPKITVGGV